MKTHERILDTALRLFNESGTAPVSTNHIADALGMSPGNLYYHFRNKEEIIRALFEQQFGVADKIFELPSDHTPSLDDLRQLVRANFTMLRDYRFIYRELIALLRRDDQLQRRWLAIRDRGYRGFRELIAAFVAAGVLLEIADPAVVTRLADLCWLISEFWPASVEVSGRALDTAAMEHGIALMMQVLEPFIIMRPTIDQRPTTNDE